MLKKPLVISGSASAIYSVKTYIEEALGFRVDVGNPETIQKRGCRLAVMSCIDSEYFFGCRIGCSYKGKNGSQFLVSDTR